MHRQPFHYWSPKRASDEEGLARSRRAARMLLRNVRPLVAGRSPSLESALPELSVICTTGIQAPVYLGSFRKFSPSCPRGRCERYPEQDADNRYTHAVRIDVPAEQPADEITRPFDDYFGDDINQNLSDEAEHAAENFAGDFSEGHGELSVGDDIAVRYRGLSPTKRIFI